MPEFCTCGAALPPDALFCHKCGKPQRDLPVVEEAPEPEAAPVLPTPQEELLRMAELPVSFHNPLAVRTAFSMALAGAFLGFLLLPGSLVWWPGAGFCAVYLYHKRTGSRLTMQHGVRMGWMTGVLLFGLFTVLFTITTVPSLVSGEFTRQLQEQVRHAPFPGTDVNQALQMMQNPIFLGLMLLTVLLVFFAFIVALCTAGGALGAKFLGRQ